MSAALVNVSGESKIVCTNRHEPRFRLPMTSQSYLRLCGVDWTRTKARGFIITYDSAAQSLRAEDHRVTHDADIATDRRNPIIDCNKQSGLRDCVQ